MSSPFQHPKDETPIVAWARSCKLSYYPKHERIICEVLLNRDGKTVVGRSLTLFLQDEFKDSSVATLFRQIAADIEKRGLPASDSDLRRGY